MAQPWKIIASVPTEEGVLQLRQRGDKDFLIMIGTQVLMNSQANRSEIVLGQKGCEHLKNHAATRVLVGGLGMGFTLRGCAGHPAEHSPGRCGRTESGCP